MSRFVLLILLIITPLKLLAATALSAVNPQVKLETEKGDIVIELFPKRRPFQ